MLSSLLEQVAWGAVEITAFLVAGVTIHELAHAVVACFGREPVTLWVHRFRVLTVKPLWFRSTDSRRNSAFYDGWIDLAGPASHLFYCAGVLMYFSADWHISMVAAYWALSGFDNVVPQALLHNKPAARWEYPSDGEKLWMHMTRSRLVLVRQGKLQYQEDVDEAHKDFAAGVHRNEPLYIASLAKDAMTCRQYLTLLTALLITTVSLLAVTVLAVLVAVWDLAAVMWNTWS